MMLFLDGSDITRLTLGVVSDDRAAFVGEPMAFSVGPEAYLRTIDEFLRTQSVDEKGLTGIVAVIGPGSATALRASLAFANTFAFTRSLPMYGVERAPSADLRALLLPLSSTVHAVPMLRPVYANEARITVSAKDALRRTVS